MQQSHVTGSLVARAHRGERDAFDRLFALSADRALLFIRLRLGQKLRGRLESMDVLQEVYVEALRAFPRFEYRGDDSFSRWLCRLIENRIRGLADHHGAKKRTPPGRELAVSTVLAGVQNARTGPVTALDHGEARERLGRAVEALDEDARLVVLLRFFQGHTQAEIAELMGRSPTAVRRLLGKTTLLLGRALETQPAGQGVA